MCKQWRLIVSFHVHCYMLLHARKLSGPDDSRHRLHCRQKLAQRGFMPHLPARWLDKVNVQRLSLSLIANNIWRWNAADTFVDPERAYMVGGNTNLYSGVEYYNVMPFTGSIGFKVNVEF